MSSAEIVLELNGLKEILLAMAAQPHLSGDDITNTVYYICRNLERMIAEIDGEGAQA